MYKHSLKIILLICMILSACCPNYFINEMGAKRIDINRFSIDLNQDTISTIDTNAIYKKYSYFTLKKRNNIKKGFRYYELANIDNSYPEVYYKFYKGGKLSVFYIYHGASLERELFNPKLGGMGVYGYKNKVLMLETFIYLNGSISILPNRLIVRGDTIFEVEDYGYGGQQFIKQKVPKEWLENWKPDW